MATLLRTQSVWMYKPVLGSLASLSMLYIFARLPRMYAHYRSWMAIGPGGIPHNVFGWLFQSFLSLLHPSDMVDVSVYKSSQAIAAYDEHARKSYLPSALSLIVRTPRPDVPRFFAPQRQTSSTIASSLKNLQSTSISNLTATNSHLVHLAPSRLEGGRCIALFLIDTTKVPKGTEYLRGEVGHAHTEADGSMHVILSLMDAKNVVEMGWGQRHMGSGGLLPLGYTMIYAPRNHDEVMVVSEILKAGIRYQTCGALVV